MQALSLEDLPRLPQQNVQFAGEAVSVLMPPKPPARNLLHESALLADDLWQFDAAESKFPAQAPPLLAALPSTPAALAKHISVKQITWLGTWQHSTNK